MTPQARTEQALQAQAAPDENLLTGLTALVRAGNDLHPDTYDSERFEDVEKFTNLYREGACDDLVLSAVVEAAAKTGIALTRDERVREVLIDMLTLVVERADGRQFFGPAAAPRKLVDSALVSVASRYIAPKTGANIVVDDGSERILLVQRAGSGLWCLPGGYADVGLSPAEVAVKETREETGLDVEITELLGVWDVMQCGGERIPQYATTFRARPVGGELKHHPVESLDVRWFALDEIPRDALWEKGIPWLNIALDALQNELTTPFFDKPRAGFAD